MGLGADVRTQAKSITEDTIKAMDGIISVIEKVKDEKSAKAAFRLATTNMGEEKNQRPTDPHSG